MAKTLVILNPIAGKGAGAQQWPLIDCALREGGLEYDLTRTDAPGSAHKIAFSAKRDGYESLIAVGGDGTIHQVVNGMMNASGGEPTGKLGFIPVGSGNDLIKTFGLKANWRSGVQMILNGSPRWIDMGRVTATDLGQNVCTVYFINTLDTGFGARVAMHAHDIPFLSGMAMYLVAVLKELIDYAAPQMRIDLAGDVIEQRSAMVAVGNGRCVGGGFWISPRAEIDDGLFDIMIAPGLDRIGILTLLPKVMQGKHLDDPRLYFTRSRRITIDSPDPLTVEADGEIPFVTTHHLQVEILPRRLLILA